MLTIVESHRFQDSLGWNGECIYCGNRFTDPTLLKSLWENASPPKMSLVWSSCSCRRRRHMWVFLVLFSQFSPLGSPDFPFSKIILSTLSFDQEKVSNLSMHAILCSASNFNFNSLFLHRSYSTNSVKPKPGAYTTCGQNDRNYFR